MLTVKLSLLQAMRACLPSCSSAATLLLILYGVNGWALAQDATFEQELAATTEQWISSDQPEKLWQRQEQLRDLIARHPDHPQLKQAQLKLYYALRQEWNHMAEDEASAIMTRLIETEDESSDLFLQLTASYAELQLIFRRGRNARELPEVRRMAQRLIAIGEARDLPAVELRGRRYLGDANAQMGNLVEALNDLFTAVDRCELWRRNGRYEQARKGSRHDYHTLQAEISNTASTLGAMPGIVSDENPITEQVAIELIKQQFKARGHLKFQVWDRVHETLAEREEALASREQQRKNRPKRPVISLQALT